jgi:hypothetical protein
MTDVRRYAATPLCPWMQLHDVASREVSGILPLSTGADVPPLLARLDHADEFLDSTGFCFPGGAETDLGSNLL